MKHSKKLLSYLLVLGVSCIVALNYEMFIFPNNFAPSGLGGLCTMIQYVFGVRVSLLNLFLNFPLAFLVYKKVSKPMALRSMVFTLGFSVALGVFDHLPLELFAYSTDNGTSTILGPIVAGLVNGFCCALVMRAGSYTGGMDYVAALIRAKNPEMNFYKVTFTINCCIAGISYFVYGYQIEPVLLCILFSYLSSSVSDRILKSGKAAIKFEIVTDRPSELSQELIEKLHHSVTLLKGKGMYSGKSVSVLMCIINRSQIVELENVIENYPGTFAYLCPVNKVVGNFLQINKKGQEEKPLLDDGSEGTL